MDCSQEQLIDQIRSRRKDTSLSRILRTEWFDENEEHGALLNALLSHYAIKSEPRLGWVRKNACDKLQENPCETVASHMWGVAYLVTKLCHHPKFPKEEFNTLLAVEMALIHDLAEAYTSDITPVDNISEETKHKFEQEGMMVMFNKKGLTPEMRDRHLDVYNSYESKSSNEAKFVKDCDRLDFMLHGFFLETQNYHGFEEFYVNSMTKPFHVELVRELSELILSTRNRLFSDSK